MAVERRIDDPDARWNKERKPPAKKNRKDFCRGKDTVPHEFEVVKHHGFYGSCRWHAWGKWRWVRGIQQWWVYDYRYWCLHIQRCKNCGKYGDPIPKDQCPDYTPKPSLEDA